MTPGHELRRRAAGRKTGQGVEAVTIEVPKRRRALRHDVPLTPAQMELRQRMDAEVARRKVERLATQNIARSRTPGWVCSWPVSMASCAGAVSFVRIAVALETVLSQPCS